MLIFILKVSLIKKKTLWIIHITMQEVCEKLNFPTHLSVKCNGSEKRNSNFNNFWHGDMNNPDEFL